MRDTQKHTGIAILCAYVLAIIFYIIYLQLFLFIVDAYAHYYEGFSHGVGAIILTLLAPNILGMLSGVATAKRIFPTANNQGIFYGVSTLIIAIGIFNVLTYVPDGSTFYAYIISNILISSISIVSIKLIIFSNFGEAD